MTLAVVVATESVAGAAAGTATATAGLVYGGTETTLLDRLLDRLASLNVHDSRIIARPNTAQVLRKGGHEAIESDDLAMDLREIARIARTATEPLLVLHGDLVMSDEQLARLTHDTKPRALALVAGCRPGAEPTRPAARVRGGHVVSAGSRHHQVTGPNAEFRGVLRIDRTAARELARVAETLAELVPTLPTDEPIARDHAEVSGPTLDRFVDNAAVAVDRDLRAAAVADGLGGTAPEGDDAPGLLLVGLVRSGVRVAAHPLRDLVCDRVLTAEQATAAQAAVDAIDEDRVRLDAAVKGDDGFFTTYAVSTYSRFLARWAARWGLTPNIVTSISMAVAVLAAVWFSAGTRVGMVTGAVLLYFAFVLDCVDGQLARYTRRFSTLGAWLDATFDRAKEYVAYAGLAMGSTAAAAGSLVYGGDVWGLAAAALILQTVRHMIDFSFEAGKVGTPAAAPPVRSLTDPADGAAEESPRPGAGRSAGLGNLVVRLSHRTEQLPGLRWAKKIVILPIGERFALISISAALFNAKVTFLLLLVWGSLATAYTLTGRVLRSLAR
ncbi:MAG: CDP-alcohol phosphatidyltransferase family protein [Actinomadura sp.]